MMNLTKIDAWVSAKQYFIEVHDGTRGFPRDELYGFPSQARRAARTSARRWGCLPTRN